MRVPEQISDPDQKASVLNLGTSTSREIGAILALKRDLKTVRANLRAQRAENERLRSALHPLLIGWSLLSAEKSKALSALGVSSPNDLLKAIGRYDEREFSDLIRSIEHLAGAA